MGKGSKKRYQKNPKEQIAQLKKNKDELEKLYAIEEDLSDEHEQRIKDLEEQNELIEKKLKHLKEEKEKNEELNDLSSISAKTQSVRFTKSKKANDSGFQQSIDSEIKKSNDTTPKSASADVQPFSAIAKEVPQSESEIKPAIKAGTESIASLVQATPDMGSSEIPSKTESQQSITATPKASKNNNLQADADAYDTIKSKIKEINEESNTTISIKKSELDAIIKTSNEFVNKKKSEIDAISSANRKTVSSYEESIINLQKANLEEGVTKEKIAENNKEVEKYKLSIKDVQRIQKDTVANITDEINKTRTAQKDKIEQINKEISETKEATISATQPLKEQLKPLEKTKKEWERYVNGQNDSLKVNEKLINDTTNLKNGLASIGDEVGKNDKYYKQIEKSSAIQSNLQKSINEAVINNTKVSNEDKDVIIKKAAASREVHDEMVSINLQAAKGKISEEQRLQLLSGIDEKYKQTTKSLQLSETASKELKDVFNGIDKEISSVAETSKKASANFQLMDNAVKELGSSIPVVGELATVIKTGTKDTLAFKAAMFALGAALGALAAKTVFAGMQVDIEMANQKIQAQIDLLKELGQNEVKFSQPVVQKQAQIEKGGIDIGQKKQEIETAVEIKNVRSRLNQELFKSRLANEDEINKLTIDATFAAERAINSFNSSMKSAALEFKVASKTALFGKAIGSVGYGAAQMQMAGIGADKVASAMQAAGTATGKMPTARAAADMAILADRTGQSQESIAQLNEYLERTDGVSAKFALNMQEGMRAMADNAGLNLANFMQEVAAASKDALGYQIKSGRQ